MKNKFKYPIRANSFILLFLAIAFQVYPVASASPIQQTDDTTAFVNVNLIPMDSEQMLANQTVIVQGDRIIEIGPVDAITVPSEAQVIDGKGAYLLPGLVDMHTHLSENQDALILYLANGVTTIRNFNAEPHILTWRDQVAAGELLGPTIRPGKSLGGVPPAFTNTVHWFNRAAGPFFSLNGIAIGVITNEADGRQAVLEAKADGYEFIKANFFLNREAFDSIVATAAAEELPVLGHVSADVGVEHAIRSGMEIQHNFSLAAYVAKDHTRNPGPNPFDRFDLSETDETLPQLAALMTENEVNYTPTMVIDVVSSDLLEDPQALLQHPMYQYAPPSSIQEWRNQTSRPDVVDIIETAGGIPERAFRDEVWTYYQRQVKTLHDAGVPILAGTDASAFGVVWGFSLQQELEFLVEAGLTPYEALEAATRVPAEVFGNPEEWGTVEVGKRADLLLLQANPLEEISNTQQIAGVMVRGQWLSQAELQGMMDEVAAKYQAEVAQMEAPIVLEPFSDTFFSGLMPGGWNELEPGVYARGNPEVDPTLFVQLAAPDTSAAELATAVLANFGVTELPEPFDSYISTTLNWSLYQIVGQTAPIALALAETETAVYLVMATAPAEQIDALVEAVFLPALDALVPVDGE
ncbi:MAG: amidohydrolase family protein [Chloroflexi bacterium]|nr:amidohydrolase family protein [Chloroflexota bacterium]